MKCSITEFAIGILHCSKNVCNNGGDCLLSAGFESLASDPIIPDRLLNISCDPGFTLIDDQCCLFIENTLTWNDAHAQCLSRSAELVTIDDQQQRGQISQLLVTASPLNGVWTGGRSVLNGSSPAWVWPGNFLIKTPFWAPNSPNFHLNYSDVCIVLQTPPFLDWSTTSCQERHSFICQKALFSSNGQHHLHRI